MNIASDMEPGPVALVEDALTVSVGKTLTRGALMEAMNLQWYYFLPVVAGIVGGIIGGYYYKNYQRKK